MTFCAFIQIFLSLQVVMGIATTVMYLYVHTPPDPVVRPHKQTRLLDLDKWFVSPAQSIAGQGIGYATQAVIYMLLLHFSIVL